MPHAFFTPSLPAIIFVHLRAPCWLFSWFALPFVSLSLSLSLTFDCPQSFAPSILPWAAAFTAIGALAASACVGEQLKLASCLLRCAGRKHCEHEFMLMKLICSGKGKRMRFRSVIWNRQRRYSGVSLELKCLHFEVVHPNKVFRAENYYKYSDDDSNHVWWWVRLDGWSFQTGLLGHIWKNDVDKNEQRSVQMNERVG